jgi:hypothetical protein
MQVLEKASSFCQGTGVSSQPDRRDIPVPPYEKLKLMQPSVTVLDFLCSGGTFLSRLSG